MKATYFTYEKSLQIDSMMDRTVLRFCAITSVASVNFPSIFLNHYFALICIQFRNIAMISNADCDIEFFLLHTLQ